MKNAFTMIELIFVIVIIGILSAIAVPRFGETANEARKTSITGFVGTLNRTVGPNMWAIVLPGGGSVRAVDINQYTDFPQGVEATPGVAGLDLTQCGQPVILQEAVPPTYALNPDGTQSNNVLDPGQPAIMDPASYQKVGIVTSLPNEEAIYCLDGTLIVSPKFGFNESGSQNLQFN